MNICFLSQEYPPETHAGGIGTYTYNMASALAHLGHTIHVISSTKHHNQSYIENGVTVHRIKRREYQPKELSILAYSYAVSKKITQINRDFDVVHSSEYGSEAFWYSRKKRYPLVTRLATPFFLIEELNGKAFWGPRPIFNWMEKAQTLYSNGIFSSTKALSKKVAHKWRIHPSKVAVIPNSVDISRIVQLGDTGEVPEPLHYKDYLLYFGRLEERKGVCIFAEALPVIFKKFPDIQAVFVGSDLGFQGESMRSFIIRKGGKFSNRIIFYDNLPQEVLFPIVNSAKMVILPSIWEAFGFVCVEAMALGRPVIATSGSGFEEIIENNISGYLIEPGSSKALTDRIINCLKDEKGLRRISEGARKRAQDFEVSKVAFHLLAYYSKIKEGWLKIKKNQ